MLIRGDHFSIKSKMNGSTTQSQIKKINDLIYKIFYDRCVFSYVMYKNPLQMRSCRRRDGRTTRSEGMVAYLDMFRIYKVKEKYNSQ